MDISVNSIKDMRSAVKLNAAETGKQKRRDPRDYKMSEGLISWNTRLLWPGVSKNIWTKPNTGLNKHNFIPQTAPLLISLLSSSLL